MDEKTADLTPAIDGLSIPARTSSLESPTQPTDLSSNATEAELDEFGKFPSLSLFSSLSRLFDFQSSGLLSDDETEEQEAVKDGPPRASTPLNTLASLFRDSRIGGAASVEENKSKSSEQLSPSPVGWAAFGLNLTLPFSSLLPTSPSLSRSASSPSTNIQSEPIRPSTPVADATAAPPSLWAKVLETVTGPKTLPCGHTSHQFDFLSGDVVLIGGMYGSFLSHKETGRQVWLSTDAILNWVTPNVHLPLDLGFGEDDELVPSGIFDRVGMINVCANLTRELNAWQQCSEGKFRYHPFAYDWRREPQYASNQLEAFIENLYHLNGGQKITVIARVANRRPDLLKGVIFAGTPFGAVPLMIWALRRGAPFMVNRSLMSASLHFAARSSFTFLPTDCKGLVNDKEEDIPIDFYNADQWVEYRLSQVFHTAKTPVEVERLRMYLTYALDASKKFRESLTCNPALATKYPPFVCIVGDNWPTPTRIRTNIKRLGVPTPGQLAGAGVGGPQAEDAAVKANIAPDGPKEVQFLWPCQFVPGDGLVPEEAQMMPEGYRFGVERTNISHPSMLNDLGAMERALRKIFSERSVVGTVEDDDGVQ
ncbi:hypothetical protein HDV00_005144 [Rhizophlyctis rosea]|nr:hypothetical protein HDV00_005144 [Rhizophlyctis rosea]